MAGAHKLSKRQAAPKLSTTNKPNTGKIWGHRPHIRLKRYMAGAPQLSKRQAAPKFSTKNKPNRQIRAHRPHIRLLTIGRSLAEQYNKA